MDASFYFVHQDDNSQEIDDQIVPSSKLTLFHAQNAASPFITASASKVVQDSEKLHLGEMIIAEKYQDLRAFPELKSTYLQTKSYDRFHLDLKMPIHVSINDFCFNGMKTRTFLHTKPRIFEDHLSKRVSDKHELYEYFIT
ncbi:hypothetical protein AVEN_256895-1 [Araneus ventricosus]|uniref:Uncharacterized protein n=1 Tax=Araneus ventricosus TaxID=182803 RepID=A0A4Y2CG08_ARAVE|nr:hypothetical protein AVEN_256895-1 [Araneus ventricosus]